MDDKATVIGSAVPTHRSGNVSRQLQLLCVFLGLLVVGQTNAEPVFDSGQLRLIPFPKQVTTQAGTFALEEGLILQVPAQMAEPLAAQLLAELKRAGVDRVEVKPLLESSRVLSLSKGTVVSSPVVPNPVQFAVDASPESYVLAIAPNVIQASGQDAAGLFYAVQTLCQLIRANRVDNRLPCLEIRDWPSLKWRCFQDDLTRGPSSTAATLQQHVDLGSELKMNLFTYYMEYQYAFRKHPFIGPADGSLTPEELSELVSYAAQRQVDILGNQQSFGHLTWILKHPQFAELRETDYLLNPAREESYQLLDDLYSEVCPLLPFPMFNVCCDETYGLGTGPSKAVAAELGEGGLYVRHVRRIHDLLKEKYGKQMMMWGDIILLHPDKLDQIPKDTVMLTWGYGAADSFEHQIIPFTEAGYQFFVCPGINNWSRILPDFRTTEINIRNFVRDGVKHGALGMLNTEWEDDGESLQGYKWHGYAWGAECAWNASTTEPQDFQRRIGGVLFGEPGDHFGQAIELLAKTHSLPGMQGMMNARFWQEDLISTVSSRRVRASADGLLNLLRPAIQHLETCRREATVNAELLDAFLLGARRMELIGQRMLDRLQAAELYSEARGMEELAGKLERLDAARRLLESSRQTHADLGREFARIWLSESKPYALDWTQKRYDAVDQRFGELLQRLNEAQTTAERGEPLPSADQVGLQLPSVSGRRTSPQKVELGALKKDAPWLEPQATHRLGITVHAGNVDRYQLPVELDVDLPKGVLDKPVRAFLAEEDSWREIPAQLDKARDVGGPRLVFVLPELLTKQEAAAVHVYLGISGTRPTLSRAVSTVVASDDLVTIENDQIKLALGDAGAHIYEWRVKAIGERDLTMPGSSGWEGFADLGGGYRIARNQRTCLSRGPALVRYQYTDDMGMEKTISLFAGCSWIEVTLSEPVGYYWDFDNPKNFAADGPAPGTYLFANGATGPVGREADGVPAQVKADGVQWALKFGSDRVALGLATPETATRMVVAPGAGAGGVGIEGAPPVSHFVTFGGVLPDEPDVTMERLCQTLDLRNQPEVTLFAAEPRP
jgi:hypothetical protein